MAIHQKIISMNLLLDISLKTLLGHYDLIKKAEPISLKVAQKRNYANEFSIINQLTADLKNPELSNALYQDDYFM